MDLAVAIAEVHVNCFAFETFHVTWRGVRQDEVANINVSAHVRMSAFVNEANHGVDAIE